MKSKLLFLAAIGCMIALAQTNPILGENAVKVSDHVWAIMGWPNVAIVVGDRAVLVVDTGLGTSNGSTISRVVSKIAPGNRKLFLTTTHFHPEHAAGEGGFPPGTIVIRNAVQQKELETYGKEMIDLFAGRSPQYKELLANAVVRTPDLIFDTEAKVDLGGTSVRLFWFGGAHTKGDQLMLVEPDQTLISGDVVQNKVVPNIFRDGGTPSSWMAVLDKISALNVRLVFPTHSAPGDASLIASEKRFIGELRGSALDLKKKGVSPEDAGKQLAEQFKTKYPDWPSMNVAGFVRSIYAE